MALYHRLTRSPSPITDASSFDTLDSNAGVRSYLTFVSNARLRTQHINSLYCVCIMNGMPKLNSSGAFPSLYEQPLECHILHAVSVLEISAERISRYCSHSNTQFTNVFRRHIQAGIAQSVRAGRSGDGIPVGARYSAPVQSGPEVHPASHTMGTGSLSRG